MLELIKDEWLDILWLVTVAWFSYDKWGYDVSFLVTIGFLEAWLINMKLNIIKLMLEVNNLKE